MGEFNDFLFNIGGPVSVTANTGDLITRDIVGNYTITDNTITCGETYTLPYTTTYTTTYYDCVGDDFFRSKYHPNVNYGRSCIKKANLRKKYLIKKK